MNGSNYTSVKDSIVASETIDIEAEMAEARRVVGDVVNDSEISDDSDIAELQKPTASPSRKFENMANEEDSYSDSFHDDDEKRDAASEKDSDYSAHFDWCLVQSGAFYEHWQEMPIEL